ncbi:hypothetical protein VNI00_006816 [Paramarasmius palmivorus]|uniref:Uncharacterized protein n=1 Tax=Paramarasmius palmivorus TaxID=297713 RepID=A0AAW0D489_9AGAR
MFSLRVLTSCVFVSAVVAHVDINWPRGQWTFTEEQQEQGGVCGGGQTDTAWAYNTVDPFISISGDSKELVTVKLVTANSTDASSLPQINDANVFNVTLAENVEISDSGNLCFDVSLPSFAPGVQGIIYVAATDPESGRNVSTCASVVFVPSSLDGEPVNLPTPTTPTGNTIARTAQRFLRDQAATATAMAITLSSEHCDAGCSDAEVEAAAKECAAKHCSETCSEAEVEAAASQCASGNSTGTSDASSSSTSQNGGSVLRAGVLAAAMGVLAVVLAL